MRSTRCGFSLKKSHTDSCRPYHTDCENAVIDALNVHSHGNAADARLHHADQDLSAGTPALERVVALMDHLFAIDREAREKNLSLADRHALRQERAPALFEQLHALLSQMQASGTILPQSVTGKAIRYTLKRWVELTRLLDHPELELSTNWAENSMRVP